MRKQLTSFAKITPRKLFAVTPRPRLFRLLDDTRSTHPVIWIAGPPGAGKTALASSYLEALKLPSIWYQIDSGDDDPATFFHYLRVAGQKSAGRKRIQLPPLTPEYLADLLGFTRRFFRELFTKLPNVILVFDNYQDLPSTSVLHEILQTGIAECPVSSSLIFISHEEHPRQFARDFANNLIGCVGWEDLRLTFNETTALATVIKGLDQAALQSLHEETQGWAAGLVLMLERCKETKQVGNISQVETMTSIFNYFTGQIFDHASVDLREFLMRTALLPRMTAGAAQSTSGNPRAGHLLADLYRRRLFTDRLAEEVISYQYHGLFRQFLLDRGALQFSTSELNDIRKLSAQACINMGHVDAAAKLYAQGEEWQLLRDLICENSPPLLGQGRHQTVQGMTALLPISEVETSPWVMYWRAISRMPFDPLLAKGDLDRAYERFKSANDGKGMFLSCSAVMDAYLFAEDDMTPVVEWGENLQRLYNEHTGFPSVDIQGRVLASVQGLMYAAPHHPFLETLDELVDDFIDVHGGDPLLRISVAYNSLVLALWRGNFHRARRIIDSINSQMVDVKIPPMQLVMWRFMEGNYAWSTGSHNFAEQKFVEAINITQAYGMPLLATMLYGMCVYASLSAGDSKKAELYISKAEGTNNFQRRHALAQLSYLRAGIALLRGDKQAALESARIALNKVELIGRPFLLANCRLGMARALIENGEMESARIYTAMAIDYARRMKSEMVEMQALLVESVAFLKEGNCNAASTSMSKGLQIGRVNDYLNIDDWWRPHTVARLFCHALDEGIEADYVRSVIKRRNITAPSPEVENWPWHIKVYTLGKFEVIVNGEPVRFSRKAQRKPLELLQCLCAFGGTVVHQDILMDALWPNSEGDASGQSFRTTLHRLRKILRCEEALRMHDRQIALNQSYVWIDCTAFERLAGDTDVSSSASLEQALSLYQGHFLQGEMGSGVIATRERLRGIFMLAAENLGANFEESGNLTDAVQCYLQAFAIEPLAETFCRRVMATYVRLGRRTEALGVYQRFTHTLRQRLGVRPSDETIALYSEISSS